MLLMLSLLQAQLCGTDSVLGLENKGEMRDRVKCACVKIRMYILDIFLQVKDKVLFGSLTSTLWQPRFMDSKAFPPLYVSLPVFQNQGFRY